MKTISELRKDLAKKKEVEGPEEPLSFPDDVDPLHLLHGPDDEGTVRIRTYPHLHPSEWRFII